MTPWTIVPQALLSMEFSNINTGVGCLFLPQEIFLTQVPWVSCITGRLFTNRETREDVKENKLVSQSQILTSISVTSITIKLRVWLKCALEGGKNINFKLTWNWSFKSGLNRVIQEDSLSIDLSGKPLSFHKQKWPESSKMHQRHYSGNEEWGYDTEQRYRKYK